MAVGVAGIEQPHHLLVVLLARLDVFYGQAAVLKFHDESVAADQVSPMRADANLALARQYGALVGTVPLGLRFRPRVAVCPGDVCPVPGVDLPAPCPHLTAAQRAWRA